MLLVHGGGWAMGDQYKFTKMGYDLAEEGYIIILPTYRLYGDAPFSACLEDLKKRYSLDELLTGAGYVKEMNSNAPFFDWLV